MALGKSALYYAKHPAAKAVKNSYAREYNKTAEHRHYRSVLAVERIKRHLTGSKLDLSHTKSGNLVLESRKSNRARNGAGNNGRLKP